MADKKRKASDSACAGSVIFSRRCVLAALVMAVAAEGAVAPSALLKHSSGSTLSAAHHGAHVCSWIPEGHDEVIFMSEMAKFGPSDAIRGGIPLCFPQFGPRGKLPQHGFFRKSNDWKADEPKTLDNGDVVVVFKHTQTDETLASAWPHKFEAEYEVTLSKETATTRLRVRNTGDAPLEFTCALHTYFRVGDVGKTAVRGLKGVEYEDNTQGNKVVTEEGDEITFTGEVDRVYGPAPSVLTIVDGGGGREIEVRKEGGFPDAVVWNPWIEKAAALADLPDEGYKEFVCVEVGAIRRPVVVEAGKEWAAAQTLCVKKA